MGAAPILGILAAATLAIVVLRLAALRLYESLLEDGKIGGRECRFSMTLVRRRPKRTGELQVSLGCSPVILFSADREGIVTKLEKVVGVRHDHTSGDEELDRTFSFRFDDRARFRAGLEGGGLKATLLKLADLGVDSIVAEAGAITATLHLHFVVPPRPGRVRDVLDELLEAAAAVESSGGGYRRAAAEATGGATDGAQTGPGRSRGPSGSRGQGASPRLAVLAGVFLTAVTLAQAIAVPMWERAANATGQGQVLEMLARLLLGTIVAGGVGFVAGRVAGGAPPLWGVGLGAPMLLHSASIWASYLILTAADAPFAQHFLDEPGDLVPQVLAILTAAPPLLFAGGWIGALFGRRQTEPARRYEPIG